MPVKHATTDDEIARCFPVMAELRPHIESDTFVATVRRMAQDGFRLAYIDADGSVVCVAGYRLSTNLALGRHLYIEDLVTAASARSRGHGEAMLEWLRKIARENACDHLHLDSGTQRLGAHRFYFGQGLAITYFHFLEKLTAEEDA